MSRAAPHPFKLRQRGVIPIKRDREGKLFIERSVSSAPASAPIEYVLEWGGSAVIGLQPLKLPFVLNYRPIAGNTRIRLSKHAVHRRHGDELVWESPGVSALVHVYSPSFEILWRPLAAGSTLSDLAVFSGLDSGEIRHGIELAAAGGVVVTEQESSEPLSLWSWHEAWFHACQWLGRSERPIGGTYPYRDAFAAPPAQRARYPGERISLPSSPLPDASLSDVLKLRRSQRQGSGDAIDVDRLGSLLHQAARTTEALSSNKTNGYEARRHPYPTGGGMGEIELYLAIRECRGLERGLYHYDPFGHDLTRLNTTTVGDLERLERLAKDASRATGVEREHEIVMLFTARIGRSLWKYEAIAYSLALRDLGGLTQNIYLVSCALGLRSCAIGMGDATLFAHLSGNDAWTEALIGELALNG